MFSAMRKRLALGLAVVLFASFDDIPASAQTKGLGKGGVSPAEVVKLREEVAKLRAELEAALQDIRDLKAALAGKIPQRPDEGPLYQGRPASRWLEQYKDADPKFREEAARALGVLAVKKKDLVPVLIAALKNDPDVKVRLRLESGLAGVGDEIIPQMIELLKDKKSSPNARQGATTVLERFGPKAKDAVPLLIDGLKDKDFALRQRSVLALKNIGPDARDAIPVLFDLFEVSFVEAKIAIPIAMEKKAKAKNGGGPFEFGGGKSAAPHLGRASMLMHVTEALLAIDPDPQGRVQDHVTVMEKQIASDESLLPRFEEIHATFKARYPREKK
jgi:HEAT repeat protein